MIKFENVKVRGIEDAIEIMHRNNPQLEKSDSYWTHIEDPETLETAKYQFVAGEKDLMALKYASNGDFVYENYMKAINVLVDISAPDSWWKWWDARKFMIYEITHCKELKYIPDIKIFSVDDFNKDKMLDAAQIRTISNRVKDVNDIIHDIYRITESKTIYTRTVCLNYALLGMMYHQWFGEFGDYECELAFINFIKMLPYNELITERVEY